MTRCTQSEIVKRIVVILVLALLPIGCVGDAGDVAGGVNPPFDGVFVGSQADGAGDELADSAEPYDVTNDKTGPTLTVILPLVDVPVSLITTVHAVAEDPSGVASVLVAVGVDPLTDTHPDPSVFMGSWNTAIYPNGPYKLLVRATDTVGNESWTTIPIEVKNDKGSIVFGSATVGSPVRKATVVVREFSHKGVGMLLGTGKTDDEGKFSVVTALDSTTDWALVTVSGPGWVDHPETGETMQMLGDEKLTSVIKLPPGGVADTQLSVWTTITTRLMEGLSGQGASFANQWNIGTRWISDHLWRPETFMVDQIPPKYLWQIAENDPLSPGMIVTLTQMALWRIAEEEQSTIFDAARKLGADLATDASFDGDGRYEDEYETTKMLWNSGVILNTEDTRYRLAQAVAELVLDLASERPDWPEAARYDALNVPGGLFDTLAHDEGPLYPPVEKAPAYYFDNDPPVITFVDPTPAPGSWLGANHTLAFVALAQDKSPLKQFYLEMEPQQNIEEHWKVKWDGWMLSGEIPVSELENGEVTITVTAVDTAKVEKTTSISRSYPVDVTPPQLLVVEPGDDPPIAATTVQLRVQVEDAESQVAQVTAAPQGCGLCSPTVFQYDDADFQWKGTVSLDNEGPNQFVVKAVDYAGNISVLAHTVVRDTEAPTMVAVKSEYVRAAALTLTPETTVDQAVWKTDGSKTDLLEDCSLNGNNVSTYQCKTPLSVFVHSAACSDASPRLLFDVDDAHLTTLTAEFDYGHVDNNQYTVLTQGKLAVKKGDLEVPLCEGTFGQGFKTPNVTHRVTVWAQDSAGNNSQSVTVEFTVGWETPPPWVGPSKQPLGDLDLASYGFANFTIHKPFALDKNNTNAALHGYGVLRYDIINPHPIPLDVTIGKLGDVVVEQGLKRGYLYWDKFKWTVSDCDQNKCAYFVVPHPSENNPPLDYDCVYAKTFQSVAWAPMSVKLKKYLWSPTAAPKILDKSYQFTLTPHSMVSLAWQMMSQNTCEVPPVSQYTLNGQSSQLYQYNSDGCLAFGGGADGKSVLPFKLGPNGGFAMCTEQVGQGGYGATFLLPLTVNSLRVRLASPEQTPVIANLNYWTQQGNSKGMFVVSPKDVVWSDTLNDASLLMPSPYYNLPVP